MLKKFYSLFLAVAMMFAMGTTALAAEVPSVGTGTEKQDATVSITKELVMTEGVSIPQATFEFTVTPVTEGAPAARIAPITYPAKNTQSVRPGDNGLVTLTQTSPIKFGTFPHAGVYEYKVTEVPNTYTGEGAMAYSADEYLLRVYVVNKNNGTVYIQTITAEKDNAKQAEVVFTNAYTKSASLAITKETQGDLADKTKAFDFTIKFSNAASSTETEFVGHTDGTNGVEVRCPVDQEVKFTLHHGQTLNFDTLPAGTRYVVTEIGIEDGYTPSVKVIENSQATQDKTAANDGDAISSLGDNPAGNLVGEGTNTAAFVNTHHSTPITGIVMDNLPFFLMAGAGVAALVALTVLKNRKYQQR